MSVGGRLLVVRGDSLDTDLCTKWFYKPHNIVTPLNEMHATVMQQMLWLQYHFLLSTDLRHPSELIWLQSCEVYEENDQSFHTMLLLKTSFTGKSCAKLCNCISSKKKVPSYLQATGLVFFYRKCIGWLEKISTLCVNCLLDYSELVCGELT